MNLVFKKALNAITLIVSALKIIETGNYRHKLPVFSTLEYDSIAAAINHMTSELDNARQQNRALTQHTLSIQEEERQRLSQELHDELGQSLTAIKVMAVTLTRKADAVKPASEAIVSICDHLITVVRSMMRQLHPLILTELGLKASLEDLVTHWSVRLPTLNLRLNCPEEINTLSNHITIQVYRIIQECLTNIVSHARAQHATLTLAIDQTSKYLQLNDSDDGQGIVNTGDQAGFGLLSIRERIHSLGGELIIQSTPEHGVHISARVPL